MVFCILYYFRWYVWYYSSSWWGEMRHNWTWEFISDLYTLPDSYFWYPSRFAQWEWSEVGFVPYQKPSTCLLFLIQCRKRRRECCLVSWRRKYSRWKMFLTFYLTTWRLKVPFLLMCLLLFFFKRYPFFQKLGKAERHDPTKFALVWNQIINSFHSEDLISNRYTLISLLQLKCHQICESFLFSREMDLMMMPMSLQYSSGSIRWPLFLLAKKVCWSILPYMTSCGLGKMYSPFFWGTFTLLKLT